MFDANDLGRMLKWGAVLLVLGSCAGGVLVGVAIARWWPYK